MLTAGALITPNLQLVRQIGAGGMATVWLANHLSLHTQVVVKLIRTEARLDADTIHRFKREGATASQVKSPHVVQVLDHGISTAGEPYLVMEWLVGSDLATRLETERVLPLTAVAQIVTQTCKALSRAHEMQIVHRDIKPQNLFLCKTDDDEIFLKVLDFGVAKAPTALQSLGQATRTGALLGTPYYMSPEQMIDAKHIDLGCDLWALGVVAFECMTGHRPFEAETVGELLLRVVQGRIPSPTEFNKELPIAVDGWFARACTRDRSQRFSSAKEMADALLVAVGKGARLLPRPSGESGPHGTLPLAMAHLHFGETVPVMAPARSSGQLPSLSPNTTNGANSHDAVSAPKTSPAFIFVLVGALLVLAVGISIFAIAGVQRKEQSAVTAAASTSPIPLNSAATIVSATPDVMPLPVIAMTTPHLPQVTSGSATKLVIKPPPSASTKPVSTKPNDRNSIE